MKPEETYEQQIEAGKGMVKEILKKLSIALKKQQIDGFEWKRTDKDFDNQEVSIFDPSRKRIVTKVKEDTLADLPKTRGLKSAVETQLRTALLNYYKS